MFPARRQALTADRLVHILIAVEQLSLSPQHQISIIPLPVGQVAVVQARGHAW
jgi:hypothetical protein